MRSFRSEYDPGMTFSACLWLGLFPLLQGGTYASITHDKWRLMLMLCAVTLLCFCLDLFLRHRAARIGAAKSALPDIRSVLLPLLSASALLLWTVLSCLLSVYGPETWWLGEAVRWEGLASQLCYFGLFAAFLFSRIRIRPVLLSAAAGLFLFFAVVLLQRGGGNPLGLYPGGRSYALNPEFQGTIGNIDMGTGYLVLLAALFLHGLRPFPSVPWRKIVFTAVMLAALAICLYLILTMGVQFGVISLGALLVWSVFRLLPRKVRLPLLILLLVLVLAVVWYWPGQGGGVWELHEILHGRVRLSFGSNRVAVWYYSLLLSRENLLTGGGSGTFRYRFNDYLADHGLSIPTEQDGVLLPSYFDTPHNEYVAQLTDHGIPALVFFMVLLLSAVFRRRKRGPAPCTAAVVCYAVQAFFSFSVCLVAPMFWVLLALSFREASFRPQP